MHWEAARIKADKHIALRPLLDWMLYDNLFPEFDHLHLLVLFQVLQDALHRLRVELLLHATDADDDRLVEVAFCAGLGLLIGGVCFFGACIKLIRVAATDPRLLLLIILAIFFVALDIFIKLQQI